MLLGMDQKMLMLIQALIQRVRDFPDQAFRDLFLTLDSIEKKYHLQYKPSEEERAALQESLAEAERGDFVPRKEVEAFFQRVLKDYDADADGKAALDEAVLRLRKLPGSQQRDVAYVIFALLNEPRFDIPPPSKPASSRSNRSG